MAPSSSTENLEKIFFVVVGAEEKKREGGWGVGAVETLLLSNRG